MDRLSSIQAGQDCGQAEQSTSRTGYWMLAEQDPSRRGLWTTKTGRPMTSRTGLPISRRGLDKNDRMQDKQDRTQDKQNGMREVLARKGQNVEPAG